MPKNESHDGVQGEGNDVAARRSTAAGDVRGREKEGTRPEGGQPRDARLDDRLEETFPASDPASASPGSD